jgi:hypothetical protein
MFHLWEMMLLYGRIRTQVYTWAGSASPLQYHSIKKVASHVRAAQIGRGQIVSYKNFKKWIRMNTVFKLNVLSSRSKL